jgi:hypothetical protein
VGESKIFDRVLSVRIFYENYLKLVHDGGNLARLGWWGTNQRFEEICQPSCPWAPGLLTNQPNQLNP